MPQTSPPRAAYANAPYERQAFHKPHTALGATGHWIRTLGILAPLVIAEAIKDPEQKWRAIRISAVATALVSEALWANRVRREREERCESRQT